MIFPAFVLLFMRFRPKLQILGLLMLRVRRHPLDGDRPSRVHSAVSRHAGHAVVGRSVHDQYQNLYTRYAGLLSGVIGAYLMVYHRESVRAFYTRTALVNLLSVLAVALIIPTAYFALASPHFAAVPRWASELYYSHHRDVFSICLMFLILAAIHASGVVGQFLRAMWSWKALYPVAQLSYRSISCTKP